VTLSDPVPALFSRRIALTIGASDENPALMLPTRAPTLLVIRRLPVTPCPPEQRSDVSDSHVVSSHPVKYIRAAPVAPTIPTPAPCSVTIADPVAATFALRTTLADIRSIDSVCVTVPACISTVTTFFRVPTRLLATLLLMLVSDTHSVDSQPVCPILDISDRKISPKFSPAIVVLRDPVDATFTRVAVLSDGMSKE
jgi:hypothetical protein